MTTQLLLGLFAGALVGGIVPLVNAELLVVAASMAVPPAALPAVVVVSATGQMITKITLYGGARWLPSRLPQRARNALERASIPVSKRSGAMGLLVLTSATIGLPPFYGVSLACGALRVKLVTFTLFGFSGRLLRFGILAWGFRSLDGKAAGSSLWTLLNLTAGVGP